MSYRITKGDLEITKNVLMQLSMDTFKKLEKERQKIKDDAYCPSYVLYEALTESLCFIEDYKKNIS